jgi:non-specific serine/threonine protein kinase
VQRLLGATRLLTLTGVGGSGKTRLAIEAARARLRQHPDGTWLVELAALADPSLVPHAVATALGVREAPGRPVLETLRDHLRPRAALLVLDNCEHLVAACAELAEALLHAGPRLQLLATSREALGLPGETVYRVPSLAVPDLGRLSSVERLGQIDAVRLFVERAAAVRPGFAVTEEIVPALAQICLRLDGIPLALELAAARVRVISPAHIAARLDDRFRLLTSGSRTALPRQQTLRAALDWSYELLSEPQRRLLRRLAVFAGGFALEAAEAVCPGAGLDQAELLELLCQLVDKSLVGLEEGAPGEARYRILETVRQYSGEKLTAAPEAAGVRERHRDWYLALAEQAERELTGPEQAAWLKQLGREHDNLRAALGWSMERAEVEMALRLSGALARYWWRAGHFTEGLRWLEAALARSHGMHSSARAKALTGAGVLARRRGQYGQAAAWLDESLALNRALADIRGTAAALLIRGIVAADQEDYAAARQLFEESLALSGAAGDKGSVGLALNYLGEVARLQGNYVAARSLYDRSLAIQRSNGDRRSTAACLSNLAHVARAEGDLRRATALITECFGLFRELGARDLGITEGLEILAAVAAACGRPERAARLLGAAEALRVTTCAPVVPAERATHDRDVAALHAALDASNFAAEWAVGQSLSSDEAITYALEAPAPA